MSPAPESRAPSFATEGPVRIASPEVFRAVAQFYEHDRTRPLRAEIRERTDGPGGVREKIVFEGVHGDLVPAYLALPAGAAGRVPVITLMHGVGRSKERWFQADLSPPAAALTQALIGAGYAVLALDARGHGERAMEDGYRVPGPDGGPIGRDLMVGSTLEQRRAFDYLETRKEIDSGRIGALGLSLGGLMAFALAAVEPRLRAAVAGVVPVGALKQAISIPMAPQTFAGAIGRTPLLMLMGRQDGFYTESDAGQLFAAIPSPVKELVWYEAGHSLPIEYAVKARAWFDAHLKPVPPAG